MSYTQDELIEAVEINVEDFYGEDVDDIVNMSVEDAFNAYEVHPMSQDRLWDKMCAVAEEKYQIMVDNERR